MEYIYYMYFTILLKSKFKVIKFLKYLLAKLGVGITSYANLVDLQNQSLENLARDEAADKSLKDLEFLRAFSPADQELMTLLMSKSKSQIRQDLFVLAETNFKKSGYFVEFGATNGVDLSNSYLLEKEFSWSGILAEPAKIWKNDLLVNRPNASIETLCVWKDSNSTLTFNECDIPAISTIKSFNDKDIHKNLRVPGRNYKVYTISLNDLLVKYQAPKYIDYLSIDTEGSEYDILNAFDFNEFSVGGITVEHNYTPQRELIYALLTSWGYKRKYEDISAFDDWYVKI